MYERCVIIMLMINIYLDESGNLGRGGDFFTIAGVVYDNKKGLNRLKRIVKKECLRLSGSSTPLDELKFHDLNFTDRQRILNRFTCRDDHSIHYIVARKPKLTLLQQGREKNLVYNFLAGLLVCRIVRQYSDDISICFDQRSTKVTSLSSLKDYILVKAYTTCGFNHKITVEQCDSKSVYNLQVADIFAGAINGSYMRTNNHMIDIIRPRIVTSIQFPHDAFRD